MEKVLVIRKLFRMIAGVLVGMYGLALLLFFLFSFFWTNKGAVSIFDKSYTDWFVVFWLGISAVVVLYSSFHCFYKKDQAYLPLILFVVVFVVNFILHVPASENAVINMIALHSFAAFGFLSWIFTDCFIQGKRGKPPKN